MLARKKFIQQSYRKHHFDGLHHSTINAIIPMKGMNIINNSHGENPASRSLRRPIDKLGKNTKNEKILDNISEPTAVPTSIMRKVKMHTVS